MNTPSGWYADATRPNTERFWDGWTWTDRARFPGVSPFESPVPAGLADPVVELPDVVSMFESSSVGYSLPNGEDGDGGAKGTKILGRERHTRLR